MLTPSTGTTSGHYDAGENITRIVRSQDVTSAVEANKRLQSESQKSDWGRHYAATPSIVIEKWLNEEYARGNTTLRLFGPGFDAFMAKKLADPDNRAWRVDNPSNPFHIGYRATK